MILTCTNDIRRFHLSIRWPQVACAHYEHVNWTPVDVRKADNTCWSCLHSNTPLTKIRWNTYKKSLQDEKQLKFLLIKMPLKKIKRSMGHIADLNNSFSIFFLIFQKRNSFKNCKTIFQNLTINQAIHKKKFLVLKSYFKF